MLCGEVFGFGAIVGEVVQLTQFSLAGGGGHAIPVDSAALLNPSDSRFLIAHVGDEFRPVREKQAVKSITLLDSRGRILLSCFQNSTGRTVRGAVG